MGPKEGDMVNEKPIAKSKLIKILDQTIQHITEMEDKNLVLMEGKIKFRQYPRLEPTDKTLRAIDVTIEA